MFTILPSLLTNLYPFLHSNERVEAGAQFFEIGDNLHFKSTKWRFLFRRKVLVTNGDNLQLGTELSEKKILRSLNIIIKIDYIYLPDIHSGISVHSLSKPHFEKKDSLFLKIAISILF